MEKTPSDVVELIIAVDLNPSNPEEPINVNSVDVKGEGEEGGGEDWKGLCLKLLEAEGITKGDVSYAEAEELIANREPRKVEEDPFAKAMMMGERPTREGMQKKPASFKSAADRFRGGPMMHDEAEDEEEEE